MWLNSVISEQILAEIIELCSSQGRVCAGLNALILSVPPPDPS